VVIVPTTRRGLLRAAAIAGSIGIAGCASDDSTTPGSRDATATSPGDGETATTSLAGCTGVGLTSPDCEGTTPTTPDSISLPVASGGSTSGELPVEVLNARLTESLVIEHTFKIIRTSAGISDEEGVPLQFLEIAIEIDEDGGGADTETPEGTPPVRQSPSGIQPRDIEASLDLDGKRYRPPFSSTSGLGGVLSPLPGGSDIGIAIPVQDVEQATVRLEADDRTATWEIPGALLEAFDAVPSFSVRDASIVEGCATTPGGPSTVVLDLTVENTGDRDGWFQATVLHPSYADADYYVSVPVPAGTSVRAKRAVMESVQDGPYEIGEWSADTRSFSYGYAED
jgi:hypothetical protein